uniref:Uncharacterized protein n=1 Tax=Rhizophora mucronata TaxID=61149 RepID=A0A2P2P4F3_RHIMU
MTSGHIGLIITETHPKNYSFLVRK